MEEELEDIESELDQEYSKKKKKEENLAIAKLKKEPKIVKLNEQLDNEFLEHVKEEVMNMDKRLKLVEENPELEEILFFTNKDSFIQ